MRCGAGRRRSRPGWPRLSSGCRRRSTAGRSCAPRTLHCARPRTPGARGCRRSPGSPLARRRRPSHLRSGRRERGPTQPTTPSSTTTAASVEQTQRRAVTRGRVVRHELADTGDEGRGHGAATLHRSSIASASSGPSVTHREVLTVSHHGAAADDDVGHVGGRGAEDDLVRPAARGAHRAGCPARRGQPGRPPRCAPPPASRWPRDPAR